MFCNLSHKDREFYPTIIRGGRLTLSIRGASLSNLAVGRVLLHGPGLY